MLFDEAQQIVARGLGTPDSPAKQMLHAVRGAITRRLGELPAVLALGWT